MKAKICGITTLEGALIAINNGAWAIGFNFYQPSQRYVSLAKAREITSQLPQDIIKVGILIDYSQEEALEVLEFIDLVQIYKPDSLFPDKKRVIFAETKYQWRKLQFVVLMVAHSNALRLCGRYTNN